MAVSSSPINSDKLLAACKQCLPKGAILTASDKFYWSPQTRAVHFNQAAIHTLHGQWALLHELAHAQLKHTTYTYDITLLQLETAAWEQAKSTGKRLGIMIDEDHVQDCLDTYREWLYARSTCPSCQSSGLQLNKTTYSCFTCQTVWNVSPSRFCRAYRMVSRRQKKTPPQQHMPVTVFSERAT